MSASVRDGRAFGQAVLTPRAGPHDPRFRERRKDVRIRFASSMLFSSGAFSESEAPRVAGTRRGSRGEAHLVTGEIAAIAAS